MAESSGDGAAPLMLSRKKRKREGETGEGEDPLKGLAKSLTSADPDLDISTSGFKSTQASNPDLFSWDKKDDRDDYDDDGGRATTTKSSRLRKKPRLGGSEGEDLLWGKYPSINPNMYLEGSKSGSKPKLGEPEGEDLQGSVKTGALPRIKTRALPRQQKMLRLGERLQKKLSLEEPEGEDLPGKKDPEMEDSKSGSSVVTTQSLSSISGGELLPLNDLEGGDDDDDDDDDDSPMTQGELQEWWEKWWKGEEEDLDLPKSPGWGYSDVDEDDPQWPDKFREKYCRQRPPKYKALLDSDYCPPGVEKKDEALWERYLKQIEESDGYDITDFPGLTMLTPITPIFNFKKCASDFEVMSASADAAIKKFNEEQDDQYEVHDILKVNSSGGMRRSSLYYITFEAKKKKKSVVPSADDVEDDQGGAPLLTTLQARVLEDFAIGKLEVQECRIKRFKPSTVCCMFVEPILKF